MKLATRSRRTATTTGLVAALALGAAAVAGAAGAQSATASAPVTAAPRVAAQVSGPAQDAPAAATTTTAPTSVTYRDLANVRVPAGHGCEYLGDPFAAAFRLTGGAKVVGGVGVTLEKTVLADLDRDGLKDGVALLRCQGPTGPHTSILGVRWGGTTGALRLLDWRTDAQPRPGIEPAWVDSVRWAKDGSGRTVLAVLGRSFRPEDALAQPTAAFGYAYRVDGRSLVRTALVPND